MREDILKQLWGAAETEYQKFSERIIPNKDHIMGVRIPRLRNIAKKIAQTQAEQYLCEMERCIKNGEELYHEEIMLYGLVIGYAKADDAQRKIWLDHFLPHIDNWAICDSCCITYKWMKKNPEYWWHFLNEKIKTKREYSIRFAFVCMLYHYMNERYIEKILNLCNSIHEDYYYVKMAVAWTVCTAYVNNPEHIELFLEQNELDAETQNKAIQKICDSYRVSKENKQKVRRLRRR